jgi:hypothetical protein
MELANAHMANLLNEIQEHLFNEGRAATRDKATERMRAKLPSPQTLLDQATGAVVKIGKAKRIVLDDPSKVKDVHEALGEALGEDPDLEAHDPDLEAAERSAMARRIKGAKY